MDTQIGPKPAAPPPHTDHNGASQTGAHPGKGPVVLVILAILLFVAMLIIGVVPRLTQNRALAEGVKEEKSSKPAVAVTKPKQVPEPGLDLPGNIQAIKDTAINARTTGYIRKLYVDIGSHVKAGDVLAEIESPDVDQQVYQAMAQTAQSRATVGQSKAQVAQGLAGVAQNRADVSRQRAAIQQAKAQLSGTQAALAQSRATEKQSEAQLRHTEQTVYQQEAALSQARASLDLSQLSYNRYATLQKAGFGALQDVDQALQALKNAQAQVTSAQAGVQAAQADVTASKQAVASAQAAVDSAEQNVESAVQNVQANIDLLRATEATVVSAKATVEASVENVHANQQAVNSNIANTRRMEVMRKFEKVIAPFTGVITARNVDVGTLINAGTSPSGGAATTTDASAISSTPQNGMFGIARTDVVRIQVNVPQTYVPALNQGSVALTSVKEFPGRVFHGNVSLRAGALDVVSRTQLVEVHIPNPKNELLPGMYAEVKINPTHPPMTLHIAGTALVVDANGTRVAEVTPANTVHYIQVVVGRDFGREVEILQGLTGSERLINNPSDTLREGTKVQVVKSQGGKSGGKGGGGTGKPQA